MVYPKIPLAQMIVRLFEAKGLHHIVISPGSRNAPLTLGFAGNPFFSCYSIADERCAAFFAMGIAQQKKEPVVLVCTSGSALLNYYPAIAEAFYSQIPLVVVSADRPEHKIDIGDGQTIRQKDVFSNHILFSANLSEEAGKADSHLIQKAIEKTVREKGPVHINVPFEEPLYETCESADTELFLLPDEENRVHEMEEMEEIVRVWNHSYKKLILTGTMDPGSMDISILDELAKDPSMVIMTETTSNIYHPDVVSSIDTLITPFSDADFKAFQPDLLVTFGGMIVSKRVKSFLRRYKPARHWHIDPLRAYNTFDCLTRHVKVTPESFFSALLPLSKPVESTYKKEILNIRDDRKMKHNAFMVGAPFSDLKVFEFLSQRLPDYAQLQVANSSPIRYLQLFEMKPTVEVFCNRGTSGIDGSMSTAVGAATTTTKQNIHITGDISFFYDSNALWNQYIPDTFKIILINNGGGGIFRILPGHQPNDIFSTYFETAHCLTAEHLSAMYQFEYFKAGGMDSLQSVWDVFMNVPSKAILEIFTPTRENDQVLKKYFKSL